MVREIISQRRAVWAFFGVILVLCFITTSPSVAAHESSHKKTSSVALFANQQQTLAISNPNVVTVYEPLGYLQARERATDCKVDSCIALTFDDGPDSSTTPQVLDILNQRNIQATFFVVGNRVILRPDIIRSMHRAGHDIGNHSWDHAAMTKLNNEQIRQQIHRTQEAVTNAGAPAPIYFRPPYLERNENVRQAVGMPMVLWNVDPEDWRVKQPEVLVEAIRSHAKPGGIVLLHDTKELTVKALPAIVDSLCKDYHCVTVSQLLDVPRGSIAEFTSR